MKSQNVASRGMATTGSFPSSYPITRNDSVHLPVPCYGTPHFPKLLDRISRERFSEPLEQSGKKRNSGDQSKSPDAFKGGTIAHYSQTQAKHCWRPEKRMQANRNVHSHLNTQAKARKISIPQTRIHLVVRRVQA